MAGHMMDTAHKGCKNRSYYKATGKLEGGLWSPRLLQRWQRLWPLFI